MAIQRAAALPAPAQEVNQARGTLARQYGAMTWDGTDRRVLLVRVPRAQPDPVNDVEEAVEFLRPADVQDVTHCLLIGDESVAQVYARPLQDLMKQREALDVTIAAGWRERLAGNLTHVLFQAPEDPRRRWRLAVRLPAGSVRELDEAMLEELADAIGPELETARMKQVCAVYLIASQDDVRLEADMFIKQMTETWQDEDRRRRAELAEAQRREDERRRKEDERRRIVAEMDRKMARSSYASSRQGPVGTRDRPAMGRDRAAPAAQDSRRDLEPATPQHDLERAAAHAPERTLDTDAPSSPTHGRRAPDRAHETDARAPPTYGRRAPDRAGRPLLESTSTITARPEVRHVRDQVDRLQGHDAAADLLDRVQEQGEEQAAAVDKLDELRQRVDRAVSVAPVPRRERAEASRREPAGAVGSRQAPPRHVASATPPSGRLGPGRDEEAGAPRAARSPHNAFVRTFLEAAGFEVLEAPTTSHAIDLAAERMEGDPQRVVARVVEKLDHGVVQGLLKTARELDVDLVLCVADAVDIEAKRLLVATKIKVCSPGELDCLKL